MKKNFYIIAISIAFISLASSACDENRKPNVIQPEYLIDVSVEKVSLLLENETSLADLKNWTNNEKPSLAEVSCKKSDTNCSVAKEVLEKSLVQIKQLDENELSSQITLVYHKSSVTNCNKEHFMLGCSNATNMLKMINDYKQIFNPKTLGDRDADFATQNYNNVYNITLQNME